MFLHLSTWWQGKNLWWMLAKSGLLMGLWLTASTAQVTPDNTLGTDVQTVGGVHTITGGMAHGENLFHSFLYFSFGAGNVAHFMGTGLENIIARVTGGDASMIDGLLQSDATLFLLNPSGIVFGPNATLDIKGSFHGSTADVLRFADGNEFAADINETSTFSVAAPSAFKFTATRPASITIEGSRLVVRQGETLSLVGGEIDITGGNLQASRGQINLASMASDGAVEFDGAGIDIDSSTALGRISIQDRSELSVSGEGAGRVVIRGGQVTMRQSSIQAVTIGAQDGQGIDMLGETVILEAASINSSTFGSGSGGRVEVRADNLLLTQGASISSSTFGGGSGGHVEVQATNLTLTQGAFVASNSFGGGPGGRVEVRADNVMLTRGASLSSNTNSEDGGRVEVWAGTLTLDESAFIRSDTFGSGAGGEIQLHAETLRLRGGALIGSTTFGEGHGGTITITAQAVELDNATLTSATTMGGGHAGAITLNVRHLTAANQSTITSSSDQGATGAAGTVRIQGIAGDGSAAGVVMLHESTLRTETAGEGDGGTITVTTHILELDHATLTSATTGEGHAGAITLNVGRLTATNQSMINSSSTQGATGNAGTVHIQGIAGDGSVAEAVILRESTLRTETAGTGTGGEIMVTAETIELDHATLTGETTGAGNAGAITLKVNRLTAANQSIITSSSTQDATGHAGTIRIQGLAGEGSTADTLSLVNSSITTQADQADGGDIVIQAKRILLREQSEIRSEALGGEGAVGGDISLEADLVVLSASNVIANAPGASGAHVNVAGILVADSDSMIQASGGVSITGQLFDLSGVVQRQIAFLGESELLSQRCANSSPGSAVSRFALVGRDGLPLAPGSVWLSDLSTGGHSNAPHEASPPSQDSTVPAFLPVALAHECD
ncbi:two-partner secretion domain-containing protein [Candidatus Entotheonella palauensis]|uniref:two-partner secretion domain-containing protein n=1 Tax=Candidatus Entotheonella palauensis TaxID=93172 RepID=UPI000B7ED387|nr:filamentous hemagglutinin N-terminal domain-containing protein [Candidatus Entotheonella palauensis]